MVKLTEFDVVLYKQAQEDEQLKALGISPGEGETEEVLTKYAFNIDDVCEVRQTYVSYRGEWLDAIVCTLASKNYETPPLVLTYEEFKSKINENNQNVKIK